MARSWRLRSATGCLIRKAGACTHSNYTRRMKDFFRTELGKTLRVEESDEGALTVDILKEGVWKAAPRGMIGLRLSPDSRSLTAAEILALPL